MHTIIRDNYDPKLGEYHEKILIDEARHKTWMFDCDGVFTDITKVVVVSERGDSEEYAASQKWLTLELEALEAADVALQDNIDAEAATREADDKTLQDNIDAEAATREANDETLQDNIDAEEDAREAADQELWDEIEIIEAASDVVDVVGTYADLENYDTSALHDKDLIKVLQDETRDDAITYYRWSASNEEFSYVGAEGPYYTASETDTLLAGKVDKTSVTSTPLFNPTYASNDLVMSQKGVAKQVLNVYNGGVQISCAGGNASAGAAVSVAIGPSATAGASPTVAVGQGATATGTCANAIGYYATAPGVYDIAIGSASVSTKTATGVSQTNDNLAIGSSNVTANGGGSTAIGHYAVTASGLNSIAIGDKTVTSSGNGAIAIGSTNGASASVVASGAYSLAMGQNTVTAAGSGDTAIGNSSVSTAVGSGQTQTTNNTAIGNSSVTSNGGYSVAIGNSGISSTGNHAVAIGTQGTTASNSNTLALGHYGTTASGVNSTAIGHGVKATNDRSVAVGSSGAGSGQDTTVSGYYSIGLGTAAKVSGNYSSALGFSVNTTGNNSATIGSGNTTSGNQSVTLGYSSGASGDYCTSIGANGVYTYDYHNIAIGTNGVTAGDSSSASSNYNVAIGHSGATAQGTYSIAIGTQGVTASAERAIAIGHQNCTASHTDSVALGTGSKTGRTNEISLGAPISGSTPEKTKYIAHVTAGVNDTDAVNVAQLNAAIPGVMTGATASTAGTSGLVPAPAAGDEGKFLAGDGTWQTVQGGGSGATIFYTDQDLETVTTPKTYFTLYKDVSLTTAATAQEVCDAIVSGPVIFFQTTIPMEYAVICVYNDDVISYGRDPNDWDPSLDDIQIYYLNPFNMRAFQLLNSQSTDTWTVYDTYSFAPPTIVQTTGQSTTSVMSQKAVTDAIPATNNISAADWTALWQ